MEENRFLRLHLEESFIVPKRSIFLQKGETIYLVLERLIVYVEISESELITQHVENLKHSLHFDMTAALLEQSEYDKHIVSNESSLKKQFH